MACLGRMRIWRAQKFGEVGLGGQIAGGYLEEDENANTKLGETNGGSKSQERTLEERKSGIEGAGGEWVRKK